MKNINKNKSGNHNINFCNIKRLFILIAGFVILLSNVQCSKNKNPDSNNKNLKTPKKEEKDPSSGGSMVINPDNTTKNAISNNQDNNSIDDKKTSNPDSNNASNEDDQNEDNSTQNDEDEFSDKKDPNGNLPVIIKRGVFTSNQGIGESKAKQQKQNTSSNGGVPSFVNNVTNSLPSSNAIKNGVKNTVNSATSAVNQISSSPTFNNLLSNTESAISSSAPVISSVLKGGMGIFNGVKFIATSLMEKYNNEYEKENEKEEEYINNGEEYINNGEENNNIIIKVILSDNENFIYIKNIDSSNYEKEGIYEEIYKEILELAGDQIEGGFFLTSLLDDNRINIEQLDDLKAEIDAIKGADDTNKTLIIQLSRKPNKDIPLSIRKDNKNNSEEHLGNRKDVSLEINDDYNTVGLDEDDDDDDDDDYNTVGLVGLEEEDDDDDDINQNGNNQNKPNLYKNGASLKREQAILGNEIQNKKYNNEITKQLNEYYKYFEYLQTNEKLIRQMLRGTDENTSELKMTFPEFSICFKKLYNNTYIIAIQKNNNDTQPKNNHQMMIHFNLTKGEEYNNLEEKNQEKYKLKVALQLSDLNQIFMPNRKSENYFGSRGMLEFKTMKKKDAQNFCEECDDTYNNINSKTEDQTEIKINNDENKNVTVQFKFANTLIGSYIIDINSFDQENIYNKVLQEIKNFKNKNDKNDKKINKKFTLYSSLDNEKTKIKGTNALGKEINAAAMADKNCKTTTLIIQIKNDKQKKSKKKKKRCLAKDRKLNNKNFKNKNKKQKPNKIKKSGDFDKINNTTLEVKPININNDNDDTNDESFLELKSMNGQSEFNDLVKVIKVVMYKGDTLGDTLIEFKYSKKNQKTIYTDLNEAILGNKKGIDVRNKRITLRTKPEGAIIGGPRSLKRYLKEKEGKGKEKEVIIYLNIEENSMINLFYKSNNDENIEEKIVKNDTVADVKNKERIIWHNKKPKKNKKRKKRKNKSKNKNKKRLNKKNKYNSNNQDLGFNLNDSDANGYFDPYSSNIDFLNVDNTTSEADLDILSAMSMIAMMLYKVGTQIPGSKDRYSNNIFDSSTKSNNKKETYSNKKNPDKRKFKSNKSNKSKNKDMQRYHM